MIYLELFLTFLKIGVVSFGGGYGMIPLLTDEVLAHGWLSESQIMNYIAVSESTPGPVAINMATFIGSAKGGILGAFLATLGVVLPAFIIIFLIASVMKNFMKYKGVNAFLTGVRPVVVGLITATGIGLLLTVILSLENVYQPVGFDWKALVIFSVVAITYIVYKKLTKKSISAILLILISAGLGMLLYGVF